MSEFKIKESNIKENIDILNEIIEDLAIETEAYIPNIIKEVANHYNISPTKLIKTLKTINSPYTANNNIVYYYNGKPIKRTTYTCAQRRVIEKIGRKVKREFFGIENATQKFMSIVHMNLENDITEIRYA